MELMEHGTYHASHVANLFLVSGMLQCGKFRNARIEVLAWDRCKLALKGKRFALVFGPILDDSLKEKILKP